MHTFIPSPRSLFWLALIAAAVIRLALLAHLWQDPEKLIWSDGGQYYQLAENWLDYGVYARDAADLGHLEQVRPPGYPAFLVLTLTLWRDPRAVALMQLVLSLSFLMGAYIFFDKLRMPWTGAIGALVLALEPSWWLQSVTTNPELLFAMIWACSGTLELMALQGNRLLLAAFSGVLLGFGILIKPFLLPFVPIAALLTLTAKQLPLSRRIIHGALIVGLSALTVFPWCLRNYLNFGTWQVSSVSTYNLLFFNCHTAMVQDHSTSSKEFFRYVSKELDPHLKTQDLTDFANQPIIGALGIQLLREHWRGAIYATVTGVVANSLAPPIGLARSLLGLQFEKPTAAHSMSIPARISVVITRLVEGRNWALLLLVIQSIALLFFIWPMAMIGIVQLRRPKFVGLGYYLAAVFFTFWAVNNMVDDPRFRVMIMPFLAFAAAYGTLYVLWRIRGAKGEPPESLAQEPAILIKEHDRV